MRLPFRVIDPRIRRNLPSYVFQVLVATFVLLVVLWVEDAVERAVAIAAIGSTAFVLFITPRQKSASPRHVLGGHTWALLVGSLASTFDAGSSFLFGLQAALAVGVAMFLMAATDTEHGPAAGTALAVVTLGSSWSLVALLAGSVVPMVAIHQLLRPWLRDLS